MNASDNMKQTQKDTFLVLFPCGSTNHTEKKPVLPVQRGLFHQQYLAVGQAGPLPHTCIHSEGIGS